MAGVQMLRGRIATVLAAFTLLVGTSMLIGAAAQAHAPAGWVATDLIEGNTNTEDAGDAYVQVDGDTVSIHWHLTGTCEGSEVTNQFVCVGSYPISPPKDRCKPGQAPDGTVFFANPIGDDDWSFTYAGDTSAFQLHITVTGGTLLAIWDDPGQSDDGTVDDGTTDDGSSDDGSSDDGQVDDGSSDDGSSDDGSVVEGNTIKKPEVKGNQLAQTGPETTMLSIIGSLFLMLGLALRFGSFGSRPVAATATGTDLLVARSLEIVERTVNRKKNWN